MAQVKLMKDALDNAYTNYKRNLSSLSRAIGNTTSSVRNLQSKLDSLSESLDNLNAAHTAWKSKAGLSAEDLALEAFSDDWLEERWAEADTQIDLANDKLHLAEQAVKSPTELLLLEQQMKSLEISITNKINTVTSELAAEDKSQLPLATYSDIVNDTRQQLIGSYRELSKSVVSLTRDDQQNIAAQHEKFHQDEEKRLVDLQIEIAKLAQISSAVPSEKPTPSTVPRSRTIEIEKCRVPTFSGKTIDYPEFKKGWLKVAASHWDEDNQIEQMKFKVDPHTKRILSRCKDMSEVWKALDEEFGQEQEVVNAVNHELLRLRSEQCTTPQFIVNLRNILPGLEESLSTVGGLEHLKTPDKVNYLVEKFDERTQHEWEYFRSKETGKTYDRFFRFLLDRYDSCRSTIARISSQAPPPPSSVDGGAVNRTIANINNCVKCSSWVATGGSRTCAACGHTALEGQPIGHCLLHCSKYENMTVDQRSDCIERVKWCPIHLSASHDLNSCSKRNDSRLVCGINGCTKHHHRSLHGSTTTFVLSVNSLDSDKWETHSITVSNDVTLLNMQTVSSLSGDVNCFFDDGSTCCLILHSTAKRLGLKGERIQIRLSTVTGVIESESYMYYLHLIDTDNIAHIIKVFAVDWIAGAIERVSIDGVKELFSAQIQTAWEKVNTRPSGEVEVLIGSNFLGLHPSDLEIRENLKLKKSKFSSGLVLAGSHPAIKLLEPSQQPGGPVITSVHATQLQYRSLRDYSDPNELLVAPPRQCSSCLNCKDCTAFDISVNASVHATKLGYRSVRDYFDSNELHVEAPRRCKNCLNCKECTFQGQQMSIREQHEYRVMENNVTYDKVEEVFHVKYPFLEDPSILTYNIHQAIKIAEREEKKLIKEGLLEVFNAEFDKMIAHGALIELSEGDMSSWSGPAHWVSLQHVLKPESDTTPLRIVTNSSLPDRNGNSVNSIMMKGPNSLSDQRAVVAQWRCYEHALSTDVTKAYYAMRIGDLEMHIRRVTWRYGKINENWRHIGFCTVSFGDKPAGVFLDIVLRKTASKFAHIDPPAAAKLNKDRYVDDVATGGSVEEVQRMAGHLVPGDSRYETNGTLAEILSKGSLKLKAIVTSGESDQEKIKKLGKFVLGIGWDPTLDVLFIDIRQSDVLRNILLTDNLAVLVLTLRILLGIINKPHDLLGLAAPIIIRAMVAYRDLFRLEPAPGWDDEIPLSERKKWLDILRTLHQVSSVPFRRCIAPKSLASCPEIIGYFDGSDNAYAAVVYIRWTISAGGYEVYLACSKAKVTPLKRISTPRSELNGAVLLSRLVLFFLRSCISSGVNPTKIWMLGDSECTLASLEKTSGALGEYFGNRVGEIIDNQARMQEMCPVGDSGEWYHIGSEDNAADRPTRVDSTIDDISPNSPWQKAPAYLYTPSHLWPTDRNFASRKESCIPNTEILKRYRGIVQTVAVETVPDTGVHTLIDPYFTNNWERLIERTVIFLNPFLHKRGIRDEAKKLEIAERLWFRQAMSDTREAAERGKLKTLFCEEKEGMIVVVGRAKHGLQQLFGRDFLPILMRTSRVAYLIMLWAPIRRTMMLAMSPCPFLAIKHGL